MKIKKAVITLLLALALVLTGCGLTDIESKFNALQGITAYKDMEYTRPDMSALQQTLLNSCAAAKESDLDTVIDGIWAYYDVYDDFYTNMSLAYIRYSGDLTDLYWSEEYTYCANHSATVDAGLEELYKALAASPCRNTLEGEDYFGAGFFDSYDGGGYYDETLVAYLNQESELVNRYYDLSTQSLETDAYSEEFYTVYGSQMEALFVELIALRQEMAAYLGYDGYPQFAYDFYYYRDYTPAQAQSYLEEIRQELVPLYRQAANANVWGLDGTPCSESQTYAYTRSFAISMGGVVAEAFELMDKGGLYDISYGPNKYNSSFEVYLDSYGEPFIFMNPTGTAYDKLTLAHEFGHFAQDYCGGNTYSVDVSEVMSQGMEYLGLCYGEDTDALTRSKMVDSLCVYVEQAAYASFEQQVYGLTGEALTAENVRALYEQVSTDYGFDEWGWDSRDYVTVTHFFTNPMYIISYVVSNDAALQLYQREQEQAGAGLGLYEEILFSQEPYFLAFMEEAGLESPFTPGRIQQVRQTLETAIFG